MTFDAHEATAPPQVVVQFPASLQRFTALQESIDIAAASVADALAATAAAFPRLAEQLFIGGGTLRRFVNVFVNDDDIRLLAGAATALRAGDVIVILPAVAGG